MKRLAVAGIIFAAMTIPRTVIAPETKTADKFINQPAVTLFDEPKEVAPDSRGEGRGEIYRVTAYNLSYQSCQKHPDHPEYGITASGKRVQEWHTIAAGPELKFGTKVYIPYFKDKPNGGVFVVEDRGGAIKNGCLDVYMEDYNECMEFGVRLLEAYILP